MSRVRDSGTFVNLSEPTCLYFHPVCISPLRCQSPGSGISSGISVKLIEIQFKTAYPSFSHLEPGITRFANPLKIDRGVG